MKGLRSTSLHPALPRIAFRFACAYFFLYVTSTPLLIVPGGGWIYSRFSKLWETVVPWFGKHVLHLATDITVFPNGSWDTTFNYVQILLFLALAAAAALVWSRYGARRSEDASDPDPRIADGLRIALRYVLAAYMLSYGMAKIVKAQFSFPGPERLLQTYGQSSPMGLLWTFMGYSRGYNLFCGLAEVGGGLLLFFRRTTTLGALLVSAAMANVVMLNLCYDVPVKTFSGHLLLMAVFLLLPDLRRLANVFVLNRPTEPVVLRAQFRARWMERARWVLKSVVIGWCLIGEMQSNLKAYTTRGDLAPPPALYGIYEVEAFTRNGEPRAPLLGDAARWRAMTVNRRRLLTVQWMNDKVTHFRMVDDPAKKTLTLSPLSDDPAAPETNEKFVLTYDRPDPEHLALKGLLRKDTLDVRLRKVDESQFVLVSRGFHWINEYPFHL
ncbi:MAG TPA: hypothetical protein VH877_06655 [Polyangia bacterium]|jgi:hypothetical protein|nr:hypothetical protein [Polyangia bacterium]